MRKERKVLLGVLCVLAVVASSPAGAMASTPIGIAGQGFGEMLGCAACIAGGAAVLSGGPASILIAANTPGSALVLAACVAVCAAAAQ